MKQTTIISMTQTNDREQRMTSLDIAAITGKQHKDVLKAIRNMEPAWAQEAGRKFALGSYKDLNGQVRPCYSLTKTECLFIATKFNDEARAKLVLRWEELEKAQQGSSCVPLVASGKAERPCAEIRLLANDQEVLDEADSILGEELDVLNRHSDSCYTPSEIGKPFGLDGRDLNSFLADKGIITWARGQWQLTRKYLHRGLTENRCFYYHGRNGQRKMQSRLVWTEKGREFILDIIRH